jgi:hypothetical protein
MSTLLTRRGFGRIALAAGVGLALPARVLAQRAVQLTGRFVAVPDPARLVLDLYVRHASETGITIAGDAIHLAASLGDHQLLLFAVESAPRIVTRAGPARRETTKVVHIPPGREERYDRFAAQWPSDLARRGTMNVRAVLEIDLESRPAERALLLELSRIAATISLPA